ncbi:hypothetical protein CH63R_02937 [Colletotrichum higginsianum IMI 349063]|uniref:Uncharacterized protein n=1 Tax=Colletotrichum higginsianum (strain IMI 349063) TaxID=759273 RepID=A0A1B7YQ97_COLHI|nr:hypothetical protein CH63R_02937 [Colletotrichum higginsianum IMI 349063]OBR14211.1 hypothetical protein CH63R_02937 [Colletotrichum higginsianum IMI 349063]
MLKRQVETPGAIGRLRVGELDMGGLVESVSNLSGHSVAPTFESFSVAAAAAYVQSLDFENKALRRLLVDKAVEPAVDQTAQVDESLNHTAIKLVVRWASQGV